GVVGVIGPWNYPLFTPMGSIAYALAAGNTVVFKPSELTPLVGQLLDEIASASIAIPDVLVVVTGDGRTGAALARAEVDKIAFTGSTATGKKVMAAAAERLTPVLMVLGEARQVRWGSDDEAHIGAITMPRQIDIIREHLEDAVAKGAKVLLGGAEEIRGNFVPPTVVTGVTPEMRIMKE